MPDREKLIQKVIRGLECCIKQGENDIYCRDLDCPYRDENDSCRLVCWTKLNKDALAMLKEQEPRVMTKEEIIGWDGYIWFEFNGMKAMKTVLIDHGMVREPFRGDYPTKELSWGTCQETWRAWTDRPTAEQRKATPWEPPNEG